jgi:hypothetical protein
MGRKAEDISGHKFGRLTVLCRSGSHPSTGNAMFLCQCECGNRVDVAGSHLRLGHTGSCGCLFVDFGGNHTHGATGTAEHGVWRSVLQRTRENHRQDYAGRGIALCERWQDFENFLADMGPRPSPRHSIERVDNEGNYEPGNCIWATPDVQNRNKRNNIWVEYAGQDMILKDAADLAGVCYKKAWARHKKGWSIDRVLAT